MKAIKRKIEKIREKPEYIRLCWVWIMTVFFVLIIFGIWSLALNIKRGEENKLIVPENQKQAIRELQQGKKSIQDAIKPAK